MVQETRENEEMSARHRKAKEKTHKIVDAEEALSELSSLVLKLMNSSDVMKEIGEEEASNNLQQMYKALAEMRDRRVFQTLALLEAARKKCENV